MKQRVVGDPRPRVVFVDHIARMSGGEIALLRLLRPLAAYVDMHVVLGEDGPLVERLREAKIDVDVLPIPVRLRDVRKSTVTPGALPLGALATLPSYVVRLRKRILELEADIVHTNTLKAALYGGAAGRLARVPVVWHIRDRISDDYLPRSAVKLVHVASRLLPTAVVANSKATLETLPHVRSSRVLYNPIVPDAVEQGATRRRHSHNGLTIGVIGRLAPWKGQHVFLEAFAEAFRGTPTRGRLIGSALFGEDDYALSLEQQAATLGIADQIEFRGFRDDIWAELAGLDVLVHCSITPEPFGQVVLEGMASGLPVVATAPGGPAELITNGVDGLLIAPGDPSALAAVLLELQGDAGLRTRLGGAARLRSSHFTPERTARQLFDVYRGVLGTLDR